MFHGRQPNRRRVSGRHAYVANLTRTAGDRRQHTVCPGEAGVVDTLRDAYGVAVGRPRLCRGQPAERLAVDEWPGVVDVATPSARSVGFRRAGRTYDVASPATRVHRGDACQGGRHQRARGTGQCPVRYTRLPHRSRRGGRIRLRCGRPARPAGDRRQHAIGAGRGRPRRHTRSRLERCGRGPLRVRRVGCFVSVRGWIL
jgi:hypothetical protein